MNFRFLVLLFLALQNFLAQQKAYLITCNEGAEVYEQFGHSALRLQDAEAGFDVVFNWGIFSFGSNENEFMLKFAKGKLDYTMAAQSPESFFDMYNEDQRIVYQSELNMSPEQFNALKKAIEENYKPENRDYRYDFFYKNCATIIRDHFVNVLGNDLKWNSTYPVKESFRDFINKGFEEMPWVGYGINLILGSPIDKVVDENEIMFHPLYMERTFADATVLINGVEQKLVSNRVEVINNSSQNTPALSWFSPTLMAIVVAVLLIIFGFFKWLTAFRVLASIVLFIFGLIGILILIMWFLTDHQTASNNWNLIWANPLMLVFSVFFWKESFLHKYHQIGYYLAYFYAAILLLFMFLPQSFIAPINWHIVAALFLFFYWGRWYGTTKDQV